MKQGESEARFLKERLVKMSNGQYVNRTGREGSPQVVSQADYLIKCQGTDRIYREPFRREKQRGKIPLSDLGVVIFKILGLGSLVQRRKR